MNGTNFVRSFGLVYFARLLRETASNKRRLFTENCFDQAIETSGFNWFSYY